jgi:putative aminopeptidase FrvX
MVLAALVAALVGALDCPQGSAQPLPERLLQLLRANGVAGYETEVRAAIRAQLPARIAPRIDPLGNLSVTLGSGAPHVVVVASLDEGGYVVSRIGDDGLLRLHRHTPRPGHPLAEQFFVGQPVVVQTADGRRIAGVTATPSTHFSRALVSAAEKARIKEIQDLWVDVGAASAADVERLGIRVLDAVSLRDRAQPLASGRVAGVAAQSRAAAQVLVELLRNFAPPDTGTLTVAWVCQSRFGGRGLARLAQSIQPDRVILLQPSGNLPEHWAKTPLERRTVPVLFADSPVEVVDTGEIAALADHLAADLGLKKTVASASGAIPGPAATDAAAERADFTVLKTLLEPAGVSGHEAPVRGALLSLLPAWAKPEVDQKGNVTVRFGTGGKELLFVAHLDETGFEITRIEKDGSARIRVLGGVFPSLYEAHPVLVTTANGTVPAVIAPRPDYQSATTAQPQVDALSVYFGTASAAETGALGVRVGQALSVPKHLTRLAGERATGRSLDDRAGSTALVLALRRIDPTRVKNRVTFAWSVEEETGLAGAAFLATRLQPEYAFAVDTFVSSDAPLDNPYVGYARLGAGPVLRGLDTVTVVPPEVITRIQRLAREAKIPLQVGVTQGGTDASAFVSRGAIDIGLSWPGRYSHSPVEVLDRRDLDGLVRLITTLVERF